MCGRGVLAVPPHFTASQAGGLIHRGRSRDVTPVTAAAKQDRSRRRIVLDQISGGESPQPARSTMPCADKASAHTSSRRSTMSPPLHSVSRPPAPNVRELATALRSVIEPTGAREGHVDAVRSGLDRAVARDSLRQFGRPVPGRSPSGTRNRVATVAAEGDAVQPSTEVGAWSRMGESSPGRPRDRRDRPDRSALRVLSGFVLRGRASVLTSAVYCSHVRQPVAVAAATFAAFRGHYGGPLRLRSSRVATRP